MSFHKLSILAETAIAVRHEPPAHGIHVLVSLSDGHDVFSLSILLDLLAAANRITGSPHFAYEVVAEDRVALAMQRLEAVLPADRLLLLVADAEDRGAFPEALVSGLDRLWRKGGMVGGWGSGCLALAAAGLLARRRFALAAEYRTRLRPTELSFCEDDRVLTSVGKTIVSDMALHLIESCCGRSVMIGAMDYCLIRRAPSDGHPRLCLPAAPLRADPRIALVDRWIDRNIAKQFKTRDLAAEAGVSIRQLERLFLRHTGGTLTDHLDHKRMSFALKLMRETDLGVDEIARSTGHKCYTTFRRKFQRKFGIAPMQS